MGVPLLKNLKLFKTMHKIKIKFVLPIVIYPKFHDILSLKWRVTWLSYDGTGFAAIHIVKIGKIWK